MVPDFCYHGNMRKVFVLVVIVVVVCLGAGYFFVKNASRGTVCFEEKCIEVEIADNAYTQTRGLMDRASLAAGHGMLFIFAQPGEHHFWMKRTRIPLDMIWMDAQWRVVWVVRAVPPCVDGEECPSYGPPSSIATQYVLETNPGEFSSGADGMLGEIMLVNKQKR